jgi:hypothetical protein
MKLRELCDDNGMGTYFGNEAGILNPNQRDIGRDVLITAFQQRAFEGPSMILIKLSI